MKKEVTFSELWDNNIDPDDIPHDRDDMICTHS